MPAASRIGDKTWSPEDNPTGEILAGSPTVFIGDGPFSISPINMAADPKPIPLSDTEIKAIAVSKQIAASDPANVEVGVTAPEAPKRDNPPLEQGNPNGSKLAENLKLAQTKSWRENGANPNIIPCYSAVGCPSSTDQLAWCAAFAGAMLKISGLPYLKTLSSLNYSGYGEKVPINDPTKWRENDIVVFKRSGGGHVGFIKQVSPTQQKLAVLGGNQHDDLNITNFGPTYYNNIVWIGRAEPPPSDSSIVVQSLGAVGSTKVT